MGITHIYVGMMWVRALYLDTVEDDIFSPLDKQRQGGQAFKVDIEKVLGGDYCRTKTLAINKTHARSSTTSQS